MAPPERTPGVRLTDPSVLRALAHPARLRMLDVLQERGGATATQCAEVVDLSASACSWHLRQLAATGLVRDAGRRGDGRERVWEAVVPAWNVDMATIDAEPAEAQGLDLAVTQAMLQASTATVEEFVVRMAQDQEPPQWRDAGLVSNSTLRLSADELRDLTAEVMQLLAPYRLSARPEARPGDRTVHAAVRFVPVSAPDGSSPPTDEQ
ncbi:helix-turn-helix domain-containing protein [Kineosporia mesophila]|uniref:Helix-turn-helix domain-containing protein n=1 Tax=Kineosporia mesophila TaxID=566012 RepID=A0ABP6ZYX2_9ACTN|nr:winged helix-turn-helix domain-containing protein [Kineosporia mesophila]MCD5353198.1 winged helix-turn-helix domain-containing protein [Kineosporia mesophila]